MNILTLDFETYYDREYSLKKMTTVEYIMDARFQPIILSYAWNDDPVQHCIGYKEMKVFLDTVDWSSTIVNAQNTQFDGAILALRFGHYARGYIDTMAMARVTGFHVVAGGASLDKIAQHLIKLGYPIPPKGKAVTSAMGKRLFNGWVAHEPYYLAEERTSSAVQMMEAADLLRTYVEYCDNDVELARQAFKYFRSLLSPNEMAYGDMILKCYIQPQLYLDEQTIRDEITRLEERDKDRIKAVADIYFDGDEKLMGSTMRSASKFTEFLKSIGGVLPNEHNGDLNDCRFIIPTKYSEAIGKEAPCYSKTHPPVIDLLEGEDEELATIFQMKLALTSSIERSRAERFLSISKLNVGFGMPYSVSGAHTHRLGGSGGLNVQNLSSGRKAGQSNALKRSITAPDGHVVVTYDASQIEARVLAYLANDTPYLQVFINKQDPYSVLASQIYGGDPEEIKRLAKAGVEPYSNIQRPAGKAGILGCGFGTGAVKFRDFAKQMGVVLSEEESQSVVQTFRQSHPAIVNFWKQCDWVLGQMVAGNSGWFGGTDGRLFYYDGSRQLHGETVPSIRLPDGNWLHYYGLCVKPKEMPDGSTKMNYCYQGLKAGRVQWIFTFGARIVENLVQSYAFALMKYQALLINQRYRIAGNTHDEWFIVVPEAEAEEASKYMQQCMTHTPVWANGLPLDCEGSYARRYGDCK